MLFKHREKSCGEIHAFRHVLKTWHGPDPGCSLGPNSTGGQEKQNPRGVRMIRLQELMGDLRENSF